MNSWKYTLRLADVFHNERMTLTERRDVIVARIKHARFWDENDDELTALVDELGDATTADEFDGPWDALYVWFDANRVWVETQ